MCISRLEQIIAGAAPLQRLLMLLMLLLRVRADLVCVRERLNLGTAASDCLKLLDLKNASAIGRSDVFPSSLTVLFEVFIHIEQKLLDLLACMLIL